MRIWHCRDLKRDIPLQYESRAGAGYRLVWPQLGTRELDSSHCFTALGISGSNCERATYWGFRVNFSEEANVRYRIPTIVIKCEPYIPVELPIHRGF